MSLISAIVAANKAKQPFSETNSRPIQKFFALLAYAHFVSIFSELFMIAFDLDSV